MLVQRRQGDAGAPGDCGTPQKDAPQAGVVGENLRPARLDGPSDPPRVAVSFAEEADDGLGQSVEVRSLGRHRSSLERYSVE